MFSTLPTPSYSVARLLAALPNGQLKLDNNGSFWLGLKVDSCFQYATLKSEKTLTKNESPVCVSRSLQPMGAAIFLPQSEAELWSEQLLPGAWIGVYLKPADVLAQNANETSRLKLMSPMTIGQTTTFKAGSVTEVHLQKLQQVQILTQPDQHDIHPLSLRLGTEHLRFEQFKSDLVVALKNQGLQSVRTASLVICPGMEPTLEPLQVMGKQKRFLPTSPEIQLKKMLVLGMTDVFEIRSCFRGNEQGDLHLTEFQMLEWYRAFVGLESIADDFKQILLALRQKGWGSAAMPEPIVESVTMAELFKQCLDFDLTPQTSKSELLELCEFLGAKMSHQDLIADIFMAAFVTGIEPQLSSRPWIWVTHWPPYTKALARLNAQGWAERMELYHRGIELANAFHELNDPQENRERDKEAFAERLHRSQSEVPWDEEFHRALDAGLPPCAGVALGVERLFLALNSAISIQETQAVVKNGD